MKLDEIKKAEIRLIIKKQYQSASEWSEADYILLEKIFEKKLNNIYLEAQKIHSEIIENIQSDNLHTEITALKKTLKKTYNSTKYKNFFDDLSIDGFTLTDKIENLKADNRSVESFLNNGDIKGSTKDFYAVCIGKKGWKDFTSEIDNNIENESITVPVPSFIVEPRQLQITGAIIINQQFIESIKTREFSMVEFYTSKQNEACQWAGILKNFDVIRNDYDKIKGIVQQGFKDQNCRVSAIIFGNGGCGKSTLLRRLAIEVSQEQSQKSLEEQIRIVWLNDDGFEDFYAEGLPIIKQNHDITFLVIIEDWFHITKHDKEIAYKFLKKTKSISNIRIVIGDRIVEKECKDLLDGEPILLSPDENECIITKILENNNTWKNIADQLFTDKNNYQCSLFLLLFIMAYTSQNEDIELNFSKPKKAFIDIIENDLKFISNTEDKKYVGLAQSLYYWACIYEKHRIFISYDTFLAIADHYNENNKISKYFSRWEMKDPILDRLKIYINKNYSKGKYSDKDFVQFNHDILADEGLSKLDWGFSDRVKVDLLEVITEFGDEISASTFLGTMLSNDQKIFNNQKEKITYVKKLIQKNNRQVYYLYIFSQEQLDSETQQELAHLLWEKKIYFWFNLTNYLQKFSNDKIIKVYIPAILEVDNILDKEYDDIHIALKFTKNVRKKNAFIRAVLNSDPLEKVEFKIIEICLQHATPDTKLYFSKKILDVETIGKIDNEILLSFLNYAPRDISKEFSDRILLSDIWKKFNHLFVENCVRYTTIKNLPQEFADRILKNDDWKDLDDSFIESCFFRAKSEIKRYFADKILMSNDWKEFDKFFINDCFFVATEKVQINFATKILQNEEYINFVTVKLLVKCLSFDCISIELRKSYSVKILQDKAWNNVFKSLTIICQDILQKNNY